MNNSTVNNNAVSRAQLDYGDIYAQYYEKVLSYINARISSGHDAEDIASDTFCKILSSLDSFDSSKASLTTWIYTIANNTMRDHLRSRGTRLNHITEADDDFVNNIVSEDEAPDYSLLREETLEVLADALDDLSERERTVVCMHYYDGISHKDIAQRLGLGYSNVRFINHRAIEKLGNYFKSHNISY